jgi:endonuclease/exonuclease/phosphatase (EEP) superfamily protein YafD
VTQIQIEPARTAPPNQVDITTLAKLRHRQWGAAMLFLLVSVGGLIGGRLGHLYPVFDVFAQFGMQFMAMALAFSLALLMPRYKAIFGVALTCALLAAYGAWPHLVSSQLQNGPFQLAPGERTLRIAHFNTLERNKSNAAVAAEILRLDPDVADLVEMSDDKKLAILPVLKTKYPYIFDCAGITYCDMAIASKYPIASADGNGTWIGAPYVRVTLGGDMAGITVVGVHTTRFPHSRSQLRQVRELSKRLENYPGDMIVMGDFNATPFSRVTTAFEDSANLMRLTELPTWPTYIDLPQLAIDHIFASKSFRVVGNQQIGEAAGSDHFPILMTLAIKRTP